MTLDTFFKKFDQFADAPNAVAKMRELVLQLAVQGKLVPQDLSDEPATELVTRVAFEKLRLVQKKEIKAESLTDPISDEEALFEIPSSWTWIRAGDLCRPISSGSTPDQSVFHPSEGIPYLKVYNIRNQFVDFEYKRQFIEVSHHEERMKRSKLVPGDVIMNIVGPPLGKVAIVPDTYPEWNCNQAIAFFRLIFPGFAPYLYTFLKQGSFLRNIQLIGTAGQDNISVTKCKFIPVPLPPLAEQKRIVAKVDELMALCDRLEAQQQQRDEKSRALACASLARFAEAPNPANLNLLFHKSYSISPADLRKAILQLAFVGKLVSQDPKDEPASILLEKARTEKARLIAQGIVKKEPWAHKLQDATNLYNRPIGWEWTHVSDVVEKVTVGFVGSMKEQYVKDGVPFLRCQNVRVNRYEPIGLTFVSEKFHQSISKSTLRPGDVVVTRSGNVGVTCVIPESLPEANCSDLVVVKRPLAILPVFLSYFINSIAAGQIEAKTVGVALTHFNTQSVAQMTVALPPLAEQRRIVAKVDQLMTLVDQLETQLTASRATTKNLLEALVVELTSSGPISSANGASHHSLGQRPRKTSAKSIKG